MTDAVFGFFLPAPPTSFVRRASPNALWAPERIILAHGKWYQTDGLQKLERPSAASATGEIRVTPLNFAPSTSRSRRAVQAFLIQAPQC
jgi:hypothetical protein